MGPVRHFGKTFAREASPHVVRSNPISILLRSARFARRRAWLALPILLAALAVPLRAQLDTPSITGVVTDPSGEVVPHASVRARETATGTVYSTVSSSASDYVFPSLHTGVYTVTVSASGFKTAIYTGITVAIGTQTAQNAALSVGASAETVTVSAARIQLETRTAPAASISWLLQSKQ